MNERREFLFVLDGFGAFFEDLVGFWLNEIWFFIQLIFTTSQQKYSKPFKKATKNISSTTQIPLSFIGHNKNDENEGAGH